MRPWVSFCLLGLLATSVVSPATAADRATDETIFCIGTPDGAALEFGLTDEHWPAYQRRYPKPITFTVGQDPVDAWPYIHPSSLDAWAGSQPHTYTIRFQLNKVPAQSLHLLVAQVEAGITSELAVAVNSREIGRRPVPAGSGHGSGAPEGKGRPDAMVFPVPPDTLKAGDNTISLTLSKGGWVIYDYVYLGTSGRPLKFVPESDQWAKDLLAGPMGGLEEVVFAVRSIIQEHWYANFGYL